MPRCDEKVVCWLAEPRQRHRLEVRSDVARGARSLSCGGGEGGDLIWISDRYGIPCHLGITGPGGRIVRIGVEGEPGIPEQVDDLAGVGHAAEPEIVTNNLSFYCAQASEHHPHDALRHGVMGYVLKTAAVHDLVTAVHAAMAGKRFLSERLAQRVLDAYAETARREQAPLDRYALLTDWEREVLHLAAQGMSYAQMGERLAISPRPAETHRGNVLRKLRLEDQTQLVRYAAGRGLLPEG